MSQSNQTRMIIAGGGLFLGICLICILMPNPNEEVVVDRNSQGDSHAGHDHSGHSHPHDDDTHHTSDAESHDEEEDGTFELDKNKQKDIWDAEHITFELEFKFGKAFKKHLKARDAAQLRSLVFDDAAVKLPTKRSEALITQAGVTEQRSSDLALADADADKLVEYLLALTEGYSEIDRTKLRVLKIERDRSHEEPRAAINTQQDDSVELVDPINESFEGSEWNTRLLLSIVGTDANGGSRQNEAEFLAGFRLGKELDLGKTAALTSWSVESDIVRVSTKSMMKEITADVGLKRLPIIDNWDLDKGAKPAQYRFQLAVADYNNDGLLDIAMATHQESYLFSRPSADEPYQETTFSTFLTKRHARDKPMANVVAWLDFNNDGWQDLILGNRLYRNEGGSRFLDITNRSGLKFGFQSMGVHVVDYDCDGLLDIYVLNQGWESMSDKKMSWIDDIEHGMPNTLFKNVGNGQFRDATRRAKADGGKRDSLACCWFFYDDDRFPDVYIANDFGRNVLLRNKGDGTFEDISDESQTSDYATTMGVVAGDLDNDSISELYVANMFSKMGRRIIGQVCEADYPPGVFQQIQGSCAGNRLYWRKGDSTAFDEFGSQLGVDAVGWAYAPAMFDINNDGLLDLYATTGFLSFDRTKPDG